VKKIEAIVFPQKLDEVRELVGRVGVEGMTVSDVRGCGSQPDHTESYRGTRRLVHFSAMVKVEVVLEDGRVPALLQLLERVSRIEGADDGKIFVLPVDDAVRIRTGERGRDAL
jgi:nitrogen regulatory protein P-II 1